MNDFELLKIWMDLSDIACMQGCVYVAIKYAMKLTGKYFNT